MPAPLRRVFILFVIALAIYVASQRLLGSHNQTTDFSTPAITPLNDSLKLDLISHAGAGLLEGRYSNSLEALQRGYADGLRLFEVDVHVSTDGHPILLHGWDQDLRQWFALPFGTWLRSFVSSGKPIMTKTEFLGARMKYDLTQATLDTLADWIRNHPDVTVELNVKSNVKEILGAFARKYPDLLGQIVAEVYDPADYAIIRSFEYQNIVWVADQYDEQALLEMAQRMDLFAIALRADHPSISLAKELNTMGIPLWAYTVNSIQVASRLSNLGVSGIYTDSLIPHRN